MAKPALRKSIQVVMPLLLGAATRGISAFRPSAFVRAGALTRRNFLPPQSTTFAKLASSPNGSEDRIEPTWTYTPFDPTKPNISQPPRRSFSTWIVPKTVDIPEERLEIYFSRSSGAGGQNVNKVNTKVEVRFLVDDADWIPLEVRERLKEQQANRINKEGWLSLQMQEYRTQMQNRKAAITKLQEMLLQAWPRPKIRKQRTGISKAAKERNKDFKRKRSETKANRGRVDF